MGCVGWWLGGDKLACLRLLLLAISVEVTLLKESLSIAIEFLISISIISEALQISNVWDFRWRFRDIGMHGGITDLGMLYPNFTSFVEGVGLMRRGQAYTVDVDVWTPRMFSALGFTLPTLDYWCSRSQDYWRSRSQDYWMDGLRFYCTNNKHLNAVNA